MRDARSATETALAQCRDQLPGLFGSALSRLGVRAERGGREHVGVHDDRLCGQVACKLTMSGAFPADLFLVADHGVLRVVDEPGAVRVGYAVAAPGEVIAHGFAWLDAGHIAEARLGDLLLLLASRDAAALFQRYPCTFAARISGVPELGDLAFTLALGAGEVAKPQFTLAIEYADAEEARARGESARDLLLSGKARIEGDSARAMMLAMTLAQLR